MVEPHSQRRVAAGARDKCRVQLRTFNPNVDGLCAEESCRDRVAGQQQIIERYREAIDLAVEIVIPVDPDRELIDKRNDYAAAGVSEYWIIDPRDDSITVLGLDGGKYEVLARESDGCVDSKLLADFQIDVKKMFAEARSR